MQNLPPLFLFFIKKIGVMFKIFMFLMVCISSSLAFADVEKDTVFSSDGMHSLHYECADFKCDFWVKDNHATEVKLLSKIKARYPAISWLNPSLAQIILSCGSDCNIKYYYHVKNGLSIPLQQVLAIEANKQCVLLATENGLSLENIYSRKVRLKIPYTDPSMKFDQSRAVMYVGMEATFDHKGGLILNYTDENSHSRHKYYKNVCI
ncbi:hypothetical protein [Iodobacter fluviatilis]|uniref:Uncharacterized protein n=1 Tax=Iodobacter fluviatilis TaxID=537 RepID=A0A377Q7T2_9NEIS|nr:hypothetical protein [Iodobacter fluviatilis]TCU81529.1 hypothetical protein EV682_12144 [Iodobacter fluviatilis]STQ89901.1 Uncharacterised protein [Iodobacter fluviatilis]